MVEKLILISQVASTWAMFGVILVVQVVHYPLFSAVGASSFAAYEARHTRRITWIVGPLMLIELISAIALVVTPPTNVSSALPGMGLGLVVVIWLSTAFLQVPLHQKLAGGFDLSLHKKLLSTNWVRTIAWTLRAVIVATILLQYIRRP